MSRQVMNLLETERTIIEYITLADACFFVSLVNSPDWLRNIGDRQVKNSEDASRYLKNGFLRSYADNGFGYYIVKTIPNRVPIGVCGFLRKPELENPDFGFALLPDYYGQGYAMESCRAVLNYGVRSFDFTVLDAVTRPANVRSIRLLEKLGFQRHRTSTVNAAGDQLVLYRWQRAA